MTRIRSQIEELGYAILPDVLDPRTVERFGTLMDHVRVEDRSQNVTNSSGTYGIRNLTDVAPQVAELVRDPLLVGIVRSLLGPQAFMVRSTLFD
ncbi:MAG: hypothetical protein GY758_24870, partial [Fuerstiella sp.]|nr:hypothetical protein [Fuerstiella sp.]